MKSKAEQTFEKLAADLTVPAMDPGQERLFAKNTKNELDSIIQQEYKKYNEFAKKDPSSPIAKGIAAGWGVPVGAVAGAGVVGGPLALGSILIKKVPKKAVEMGIGLGATSGAVLGGLAGYKGSEALSNWGHSNRKEDYKDYIKALENIRDQK